MIVEIAGLPGVGKSYVVSQIKQRELGSVITVKSKLAILYFAVRFYIMYPRYTFMLLHVLMKQRVQLSAVWNILFVRNAKYFKAASAGSAICVIEEGTFQNIFSVADTLEKDSVFLKIVTLTPKPDLLLLLDMNESVRIKRLEKRSQRREDINTSSKTGLKLIHSRLISDNFVASSPYVLRCTDQDQIFNALLRL